MVNIDCCELIHINCLTSAYPVYVGRGLIEDLSLFLSCIKGNQVLIVTNSDVGALYLKQVQLAFSGMQCDTAILPEGEIHKNQTSLALIYNTLIEKKHDRQTTLVALGGGVVGDITGFAASTYLRGVSYIQIPTTLLAQVDAAIGGKTAINYAGTKNMIGTFYQPSAVLTDVCTLQTLPEREFRAGVAEIIKYALLVGGQFLEQLESMIQKGLTAHSKNTLVSLPVNTIPYHVVPAQAGIHAQHDQNATSGIDPRLRGDDNNSTYLQDDALDHLIASCVRIKASFVEADERDHHRRALLNLGHTFAHALEAYTGFERWLHGEAVGIGLACAVRLSTQRHGLNEDLSERLDKMLILAGLPNKIPADIDLVKLESFFISDKKTKNNQINFVLMKQFGDCYLDATVSKKEFRLALSGCQLSVDN